MDWILTVPPGTRPVIMGPADDAFIAKVAQLIRDVIADESADPHLRTLALDARALAAEACVQP